MHFKTEQDREPWTRQMGVGADGVELGSEDASRRAERAQDGRKHGALERLRAAPCSLSEEHGEATRQEPDPKQSH